MSTPPAPQVWPCLRAHDVPALLSFLVDAFGFERVVEHTDGDVIVHAELAWPPGGGVMVGAVRPDGPAVVSPPGGFGAYAVTAEVDAVHARAVAAGAEIVLGLHDTDYGSREFAARDPEGNTWSFGTYPGEPRPS